MYAIEITTKDYTTGQLITRQLPKKYKSMKAAQRAADQIGCIVRPNGGQITKVTDGRVIAV
ncbi:MAG: hypothetical protein IH613_13500 [Desulfuromonadales bacterium]|nr:hypothetical protein [Desulfuromonadales bacterium]